MTGPERAYEFDFWIGSWTVTDPAGDQVGTNEITPLFDGIALAEHWRGRGGVEGRSLNAYDAARQVWHQTWMDSTGSTLLLEGGRQGEAMVLEGTSPAEDGSGRLDRHRITWTPDPATGAVRQLWETSVDEGITWEVAFDGRYVRAGGGG